MSYQFSTSSIVLDEIDRLSLSYERSKEYLSKIATGIDQQISTWQNRRQTISNENSSSFDQLLPKTQHINQLILEAVEALCRVELLIEQIIRIDPKSLTMPNASVQSSFIENPTFRPQTFSVDNRNSFRPLTNQNNENFQRFHSPIRPNHHSFGFGRSFSFSRPQAAPSRTTSNDSSIPPLMSSVIPNYSQSAQMTQRKGKIKLQKIAGGTIWKSSRVNSIESLSKFTVEDFSQSAREEFDSMFYSLNSTYSELENSSRLVPLREISIGDFGVAKSNREKRWARARCIMCEGRDQIRIVFVDFGQVEVKSMNEFFPIETNFTFLPARSVACTLSEAAPNLIENENFWPKETTEIFQNEILNKTVEIHFLSQESDFDEWPLHFVRIFLNHQNIVDFNCFNGKILQKSNQIIATKLSSNLTEQDYIVFNVSIADDETE